MKVTLDKLHECESRYLKRVEQKAKPEAMEYLPETAVAYVEQEEALEPADNIIPPEDNLDRRKQMIKASSIEPVDFALERAVGNNDSVYSNFIELIVSAKEKVGRIVVKEGVKNTGYATGFMVSERLLLTNWHVFKTRGEVAESEVQFFYELDIFGRPRQPTIFKLAPNEFYHSDQRLDYCLVAVQPRDIDGNFPLSNIGYHFLNPDIGKLVHEGKELLNIIHHPDGDFKQLSIRENEFVKMLPTTMWYKSDTAPGSSGGPVFNDQWQIVALHHMGIPSRSKDQKYYLDKNGKPIIPVDNKIDLAKIHWIANEGIRISVLLEDVFAQFPNDPLIAGLRKKPIPLTPRPPIPPDGGQPVLPEPKNDNHIKNQNEMNNSSDVNISFPASLIEANGNITIHIDNRSSFSLPAKTPDSASQDTLMDEDFELKRLEKEVDYDACRGYQSNFLCVHIPLPKPKDPLKGFVAKLLDGNSTVLDYHHFSVIQHAIRKMPIISAINVDGNPEKRKDFTERKDTWLRDTRMDFDLQLNDKFYKKSGFDKGHMSRREDANYGDTPALAKRNADLTCVYTNAGPQVPKLNRSTSKGLWGKLEKLVLEYGIDEETGKTSKITVFNGPIFSPTDKAFRGIQIPMEYWKIILWYSDDDKLKATGFKLSQAGLVKDIDFEALDFDQNLEFQPLQISIKALEDLTNLDFSAIIPFDTFDNGGDEEPLPLDSEEEVLNLIGVKKKK